MHDSSNNEPNNNEFDSNEPAHENSHENAEPNNAEPAQDTGENGTPDETATPAQDEVTTHGAPVNPNDVEGELAALDPPKPESENTESSHDDATEATATEATPEAPPRPTAVTVNFGNIPALLKLHPNWLLWRYVYSPKEKKPWTKVPYQVSGYKAKVNDPSTWNSFDAVKSVYEAGRNTNSHYDGVGFVLTQDLGIVGVDMDNQRGQDGTWSDDVTEQVAALQTYGEVSPSGRGVRFFGLGTLPENDRKHGDFEIYNDGRYLTVTGKKLDGAPDDVLECETALHAFHAKYIAAPAGGHSNHFAESMPHRRPKIGDLSDDEILERAMKAKNGARFKALWDGDLSDNGGDASAADLALCNRLAYWTGKDAPRMDRFFRRSKLMRPKWDQPRYAGGVTYGKHTIELAMRNCTAVYDPSPFVFPKLSADKIPEALGKDKNGKRCYGARQIVKLLYPHWDVAGLSTNAAHAWRLREHMGDDLRYTPNLGWLQFNGQFWDKDDRHHSRTAAIAAGLSKQVRKEAQQLFVLVSDLAKAGRPEDATAMAAAAAEHNAHAQLVEDKRFVMDTLHFAAGQDKVRVDIAQFDPKPWVLGFKNGVWDHGTWRKHFREDYFLHVCPVEIDPDTISKTPEAGSEVGTGEWAAVLDRICDGNAELKRTLQDIAGYVLSGSSHLRLILWAYGGRGTGKSTLTVLLKTILGEHCKGIQPSDLGRRGDRDRLGVKLWNKRLAICAEVGFQQIEPELLKTLSGGDTLSVRHLFRESFDALPYHVLCLVSNDPPRLDAYDDALKDRVLALPFVHPLNGKCPLLLTGGKRIEEVRKLPTSLLAREFAVWAVQGLANVYQTQEVFRAQVVEGATKQFWKDTDPLTTFWETVPVDLLLEGIFKKKLRTMYENWCTLGGTRPFTYIPWNRACESIGLVECRRTQANIKSWVLEVKPDFISDAPSADGVACGGSQATKAPRYNIFGDEIEESEAEGVESSTPNLEDLL